MPSEKGVMDSAIKLDVDGVEAGKVQWSTSTR